MSARRPLPYGLGSWGEGFFDVSPEGHLLIRPHRRDDEAIDLAQLLVGLRSRGLALPVLLRIEGVVPTRLADLVSAFAAAGRRSTQGCLYRPVYPIKVNQERWVIGEVLKASQALGRPTLGLEAGSKTELLAVLGLAPPESLVVVNGYKDRDFLETALDGVRLGHEVVVVIEKFSELERLLDEIHRTGTRPRLGVRVRLASVAAGKWQNTGGAKSKFGLTAGELLALCERLRAVGATEWLDLLHVHLGSQIANLRDIQAGIHEAARFYIVLRRLGFPIRTLDVGGGLGVDYEGTRSRHDCSMNYTLGQYAEVIVRTLDEVSRAAGEPMPEILSESGRALTAHHALLLADVVERETPTASWPRSGLRDDPALADLAELADRLDQLIPEEAYQEAVYWLQDVHARFLHGALGLEERAAAEARFVTIAQRLLEDSRPLPTELRDDLEERLAERLFCNFSVFQSLPDVWALDQIFPIVPLEGLEERPSLHAVVRDLTCDSDGRIDRYVTTGGTAPILPLPFRPGTGQTLAFCLLGAYQDILGDIHNLFGATTALAVAVRPGGEVAISTIARHQSAAELLRRVHCAPEELVTAWKEKLARGDLGEEERTRTLERLVANLEASTYLGEQIHGEI